MKPSWGVGSEHGVEREPGHFEHAPLRLAANRIAGSAPCVDQAATSRRFARAASGLHDHQLHIQRRQAKAIDECPSASVAAQADDLDRALPSEDMQPHPWPTARPAPQSLNPLGSRPEQSR